MKKFLSLTLAAIMLMSTLLLTSCDPVGTVEGFINKILGKEVDPEVIVRTTITEEEWLNTYNLKNYTFEQETSSYKIYTLVADPLVHTYIEQDLLTEYYYQSTTYDLSKGLRFAETSMGWLAEKVEDFPSREEICLSNIVHFPKCSFDELVYDEQNKGYKYEKGEIVAYFYFEEGTLVNADIGSTAPNKNITVKIKNVGTTVIDIDEYTVVNDGKVDPSKADKNVVTTITNEQLLAHLDIRNLTVCATAMQNGMAGEINLQADEDGILISISSVYESKKGYVAIFDGEYHTLNETISGEYVALEASGTVEEVNTAIEEVKMQIDLEYLTYDEEGRYYKLEADGEGIYFYFENGKLVKFVLMMTYSYPIEPPDPSMEPEEYAEYMEVVFIVSDIGTTDLDLPEYTIPEIIE